MNHYSFQAFQCPAVGAFTECYVTVERNGVEIERHYFETPEWALAFKRTCEALDKARYPVGKTMWSSAGFAYDGGTLTSTAAVYTKEEVDALLRRITSLEHWLEPLRAKARRFYELAMWGERGRV